MTNSYVEMKREISEEINNFPSFYAFDTEQFEEGLVQLGLKRTDEDKVKSIGMGGFVRKEDHGAYYEMHINIARRKKMAIDADTTGEGFIYEMFYYELANHEYGYTQDVSHTLDALNFTFEEIEADPRLKHGLELAKAAVNSAERFY
ncbi:hypothetical protein ABGV42_00390 [Paenibacillus pabuli]|uniref:DUF7659 family protein n=1 Tax=Paenibacillus pabuli TaxID=1472 RepID=UPI003242A8C7